MIDPIALIVLNGATIDTEAYGEVEDVHSVAVKEYHLNEYKSEQVYNCMAEGGTVWINEEDVDEIVEINQ